MTFEPQTLDIVTAIAGGVAAVLAAVSVLRLLRAPQARAAAAVASSRALWRTLLRPLARGLRPSRAHELEELRLLLLRSGRGSDDAIERYCEERLAWSLAGLVVAGLLLKSGTGGAASLSATLAAVVGVFGPGLLLRSRAEERREMIAGALPQAVDLLATCMYAGGSLQGALDRVARYLRIDAPELADELATTVAELQAGMPMPEALRRLADRVGDDELSTLCSALRQAFQLGAPIADALGAHAESARRQRLSELEEQAGKLAAKLNIPLTLFFLPVAVFVILAPAAIQIMRILR